MEHSRGDELKDVFPVHLGTANCSPVSMPKILGCSLDFVLLYCILAFLAFTSFPHSSLFSALRDVALCFT